jgi:Major Facilitator Superfamily
VRFITSSTQIPSRLKNKYSSVLKKDTGKRHPDERSPLLGNHSGNWSTQTLVSPPRSDSQDTYYEDSPYLLDLTTFKFWLIFGPILIQYFVAMFDSFLMVSSHPVITSYFNASNSASWLSTAFMLTSAALQPIFGRMSDMFGRRPIYMTALLIFAIGTGWCAGAQSIGHFIAGRAVCGMGAGAMISLVSIVLYL